MMPGPRIAQTEQGVAFFAEAELFHKHAQDDQRAGAQDS